MSDELRAYADDILNADIEEITAWDMRAKNKVECGQHYVIAAHALAVWVKQRRFVCERCGGTGEQEAGCYSQSTGKYDSKAGRCESCGGTGKLGVMECQE